MQPPAANFVTLAAVFFFFRFSLATGLVLPDMWCRFMAHEQQTLATTNHQPKSSKMKIEEAKKLTRQQWIEAAVDVAMENLSKVSDDIVKPSRELVTAAFDSCVVRRRNKIGLFNWRKSSPGLDSRQCIPANMRDAGDQLWKLLKFHRSAGDLWGYPWEHRSSEHNDALDTLAIVMLKGSRAAENWKQALRGR